MTVSGQKPRTFGASRRRYEVMFPIDIGSSPGSSDDLEEAGRIFLGTSGATDIYDHEERRFVSPEEEIDCVAEAFEKWQAERTGGL